MQGEKRFEFGESGWCKKPVNEKSRAGHINMTYIQAFITLQMGVYHWQTEMHWLFLFQRQHTYKHNRPQEALTTLLCCPDRDRDCFTGNRDRNKAACVCFQSISAKDLYLHTVNLLGLFKQLIQPEARNEAGFSEKRQYTFLEWKT